VESGRPASYDVPEEPSLSDFSPACPDLEFVVKLAGMGVLLMASATARGGCR